MWGRSIGFRLTAWYGLILVLVLSASSTGLLVVTRNSVYDSQDEELGYRMANVRKHLERVLRGYESVDSIRENLKADLALQPGLELLQVCDSAGNWLLRSRFTQRYLSCSSSQEGVQSELVAQYLYTTAGPPNDPWRVLTTEIEINGQSYVLQLGAELEVFERAIEKLETTLITLLPIGIVLASAVGYWMSRRALAPVDEIAEAARSISAENLSRRLIVPKTGDELQRLSETLNGMIERVELAFQRLDSAYRTITRFTADASHELRTPVAVIRAKTEICLQTFRTEEKYRDTLRQILWEVERTSRLIEDLMMLSRADSGQEVLIMAPLDLGAAIKDAVDEGRALAETKHITLDMNLPDKDVTILGDEDALRRLFLILVDNAVKYTPSGGKVSVVLRTVNGYALGDVRDSGIGISESDLPHVFERFYRADKARSRSMGGIGLGLSIARWISQAHHGDIDVQSTVGKGCTFRVRLPAARAASTQSPYGPKTGPA